MNEVLQAAVAGLALDMGLAVVCWLGSVWRRDASLVDRFWSGLVFGPAIIYAAFVVGEGARAAALLAGGSIWAIRLGAYVTWRNWGHGEDRRYQAIRERNQPGFEWKSLYLVFCLQAVLAWIVSWPFLAGIAGPRPVSIVDLAGLALALFGVVFEAVADAQLACFKSDLAHRGKVMDGGLWRYSRHPNYFGEACVWWGFSLVGWSASGLAGLASLASALVMTVLLLKVSGVTLLEKDIGRRRPEYRGYVDRTNAFWPGPPRRRA
jgi:steroid 5-alpha reductase family enzyme